MDLVKLYELMAALKGLEGGNLLSRTQVKLYDSMFKLSGMN